MRATFLVYAAVQFVVLTVVAMLVYPGGAKFDLDSNSYLFLGNFFSDLGATKTYSGRGNTASHALFSVALATVGLALMMFSTAWGSIFERRNRGRMAGRASQVLAIASGLGFIGIAATPWDRVLDAHNTFVRIAFGLLLAYLLCLTALQALNHWPRGFVVLNAVYLFVLAAYVVILFGGPTLETRDGLELQVAAQKIIVYTSIANLGLQALGVRREQSAREGTLTRGGLHPAGPLV